MTSLKVHLLSSNARIPTIATKGSAGYDLYAATDGIIPARSRRLVPTDIAIEITDTLYGAISSRSSLGLRHGIVAFPGVIDSDYRGPIGVILFNHSDEDFVFKRHDRIAQLILVRIERPNQIEAGTELNLSETERGTAGFGSTGV